jgi:biopolymer transport protein ExbB/TolQ
MRSPNAEVLGAVQRASGRSASVVHAEMKRGLSSLASIAATAPLVGVLGWVLGFYNSFPGMSGSQWTMIAIVTERLSESLMPIELGLLVAILAFCGHKYFEGRLEDFDLEMESVSLELMNQLASASV